MRKKIILLLSVLMTAFALCSCSPKNTETMDKAQKALEEGDYESAAAYYEAAAEEGKQLQACYRGKGIALMGKMEYKQAEEAFNKALDSATIIEKKVYRDGMEDDIRRYLASCYIHDAEPEKMERGTAKAASGDLQSAKADFDRAINMDRGNYELILQIAQTLEKYGGKSIGEGYLAGVSSMENGIDPVLKGKILYFLDDYEGALRQLSDHAGTNEAAALIVCRCYIALDDAESARSVIDSFGSKADSSPELLGLLGSILMKQENYSEAIEVYERAVNAAKGTPELQNMLFNRVVAYEKAGDFSKAAELLSDYLNQYSGDEEAKREMRFLKTR